MHSFIDQRNLLSVDQIFECIIANLQGHENFVHTRILVDQVQDHSVSCLDLLLAVLNLSNLPPLDLRYVRDIENLLLRQDF